MKDIVILNLIEKRFNLEWICRLDQKQKETIVTLWEIFPPSYHDECLVWLLKARCNKLINLEEYSRLVLVLQLDRRSDYDCNNYTSLDTSTKDVQS